MISRIDERSQTGTPVPTALCFSSDRHTVLDLRGLQVAVRDFKACVPPYDPFLDAGEFLLEVLYDQLGLRLTKALLRVETENNLREQNAQ